MLFSKKKTLYTTISTLSRSQIAKRKDNVTFHCVAEGNPGPQYLWTRGRQDSLVQVNIIFFVITIRIKMLNVPFMDDQAGKQNLSLVATEKTEAVYRCQVE